VRVVFRTDASLRIGSRYDMRCLALVDALCVREKKSIFLSRDHPSHVYQVVRPRGHPLLKSGKLWEMSAESSTNSYRYSLSVSQESDAFDARIPLARVSID